METKHAISALGALAQEHRLAAFRLLVRAGNDGIAAGELARQISLPHHTMSSHLTTLSQAGL
ncbi:MAG TPA: transcriptional regulator, partial [Thalassospira sp.]|nr:transcriptional regulator [Thalassospira sp.]